MKTTDLVERVARAIAPDILRDFDCKTIEQSREWNDYFPCETDKASFRHIAQAALEAAGVPALQALLDEAERVVGPFVTAPAYGASAGETHCQLKVKRADVERAVAFLDELRKEQDDDR